MDNKADCPKKEGPLTFFKVEHRGVHPSVSLLCASLRPSVSLFENLAFISDLKGAAGRLATNQTAASPPGQIKQKPRC